MAEVIDDGLHKAIVSFGLIDVKVTIGAYPDAIGPVNINRQG